MGKSRHRPPPGTPIGRESAAQGQPLVNAVGAVEADKEQLRVLTRAAHEAAADARTATREATSVAADLVADVRAAYKAEADALMAQMRAEVAAEIERAKAEVMAEFDRFANIIMGRTGDPGSPDLEEVAKRFDGRMRRVEHEAAKTAAAEMGLNLGPTRSPPQ